MSNEYDNIRPDIINTIRKYADHGRPTGDFVKACLENNLSEALARADDTNILVLREIMMYIYWEVPSPCWGSKEQVADWLALDWSAEREHWRD